ncbi:SDR family oxidoreductase [Salinisphaera sp. G21_0]|uniref:SDR family NAD(P)-dependent oxidoreductase n=1 Tax=Salinisphaera sp. G21_0 TaxID=2821094 RepID=UPI001ADB4C52|nr:SDR family oxidoreductase [Salinisphaera sp. G21_0]MBO9482466.1 SDR family oxidoreductase [Salinisphaera sp. G21_0]
MSVPDKRGSVVLITGGTSGIGRATALAFARNKSTVLVCGRREDAGEQTVDAIRRLGGNGMFIRADVSDPDEVRSMFAVIRDQYGTLDCAFNNAGNHCIPRPLTDTSTASWNATIATHLTGTWLCMKHELVMMSACSRGVIINMSSVTGLAGTSGLSAYTAAKHAVIGLTKVAALEYATQGIRINALAPGGILTNVTASLSDECRQALADFHPLKRLGMPDEVANAVVWLCSDEASFITGNIFTIDGGVTAGYTPF